MAADAVPASPSRRGLSEVWWFRLVVRTILALLALWAVYFAERRHRVFVQDPAWYLRMDVWLWLSWIGSSAAAGLLFALAAWLPFARVRYLWSRLLLAALAALPLAHFWLIWGYLLPRGHDVPGWLGTGWFWGHGTQYVLAALVGVAIASGFVAKGDFHPWRAKKDAEEMARRTHADGEVPQSL
jgi:hypothetical protein